MSQEFRLSQQRAGRGRLRVCVIPAHSSDLDSELAEPFSFLPEWIEKALSTVTLAIILGCACYMPFAVLSYKESQPPAPADFTLELSATIFSL